MAVGIEPRWNGTLTAWATVSPRASQRADEKSMPSRTTVEWAVRMIVVAISSAIDCRAFATICRVTGSDAGTIAPSGSAIERLPLEHEGRSLVLPAHRPPVRDYDRRVVLVDEERPRLGV